MAKILTNREVANIYWKRIKKTHNFYVQSTFYLKEKRRISQSKGGLTSIVDYFLCKGTLKDFEHADLREDTIKHLDSSLGATYNLEGFEGGQYELDLVFPSTEKSPALESHNSKFEKLARANAAV